MGRYFGIAAIDLVVRRNFGKMVCYKNGKVTSTPLENIYGKLNLVDVATQYDTDRYNGRRTILNTPRKK
jgi:6-phosphofructokinase 1